MSGSTTLELVEDLKAKFETFKTENDKLLAQKADKGVVDSLQREKVESLNKAITETQTKLAQLATRADGFERRIETDGLFGAGKAKKGGRDWEKIVAEHERFFALERPAQAPRKFTVEQMQAYDESLCRYVRVGRDGLSAQEMASMSVGSDPGGGYWVTPDRTGRIVSKIFETSPIRQIANVVTISTDALEGPKDLNETDAGWVGETDVRDSENTTTPDVGVYRIPVAEMYAMPRVTQKLLDDAAYDVEAWLERKIADKMARVENAAFVTGNGVNKPQGFLAGPTPVTTADATRSWGVLQYIASGASGAFASSNPGDKIIDLVFALKTALRQNARFVMARATEAETRKLKDGQGNYLWQPDFTQRGQALLVGFPVTNAEDMTAIAANSFSIAFGDFMEGYQIVDRQGIRLLRDNLTLKGWVKYYTTKRVGGMVVNSDAIKLMKFAAS